MKINKVNLWCIVAILTVFVIFTRHNYELSENRVFYSKVLGVLVILGICIDNKKDDEEQKKP